MAPYQTFWAAPELVDCSTNLNIYKLQHGPTEPTHHDLLQSMATMLELAQHGWICLVFMRDSFHHSYNFFFHFKAICGKHHHLWAVYTSGPPNSRLCPKQPEGGRGQCVHGQYVHLTLRTEFLK